jgi:hypothetical protein
MYDCRASDLGYRALIKGLDWSNHGMDMLVSFTPGLVREALVRRGVSGRGGGLVRITLQGPGWRGRGCRGYTHADIGIQCPSFSPDPKCMLAHLFIRPYRALFQLVTIH